MSRLLQDVVGELSKLPGVGRRTALRLAIHILRMERESVAEMTESIDRFRNEVKYCTQCNNLSDEEVCPICADDERDHTTVREELHKRGVSAEESQRFTSIITKCDEAQYSPAASAQMSEVYAEGVDIISRIEAVIKR